MHFIHIFIHKTCNIGMTYCCLKEKPWSYSCEIGWEERARDQYSNSWKDAGHGFRCQEFEIS